MTPRVLVAGVGNLLLGDDGFGVEVVRRLAARPPRAGVTVRDFGVRGFDLTYALLEGYDLAILVDATHRRAAPGTLYVLAIDPEGDALAGDPVETHAMTPARVLCLVRAMGGEPPPIRVVACDVAPIDEDDVRGPSLSPAVRAAVEPALAIIEELVAAALRREDAHA